MVGTVVKSQFTHAKNAVTITFPIGSTKELSKRVRSIKVIGRRVLFGRGLLAAEFA